MAAGCVTVPTYTTNTVRDHTHILENSGARAVIVSNQKLAKNLIPAVLTSTDCHHVIGMESIRSGQTPDWVSCHDWAKLASGAADIAELEQQVAAAQSAAKPSGSFLGGAADKLGPWGWRADPAPQQAAQAYAQPMQQPPQPVAPQPGYAPYASTAAMAPSAGGGFLRSALTTAAGVAGGALLFQGIESLFGAGHGLGGFGSAAPGLTETVVNNYYGDAAPGADLRDADAAPADDQGVQDADYQDDGSQDFGGDDFGGGGDDTVGV